MIRMAGGSVDPALTHLNQFAPVLLIQLYFVFLRSGFDALPGGVAEMVKSLHATIHEAGVGDDGIRAEEFAGYRSGAAALTGNPARPADLRLLRIEDVQEYRHAQACQQINSGFQQRQRSNGASQKSREVTDEAYRQ